MYDFRRMTPAERREVLRQRWARGLPLHATPHFRGVSGEYLITAACYEHRHIFDTPKALSCLTNEVLKAFHAAGLPCSAWVFLPNHHALVGTFDLSVVSETLRIVHSRVAAAMNFQQGEERSQSLVSLQRSPHSQRAPSLGASVNYIHYNPVKHGYVKKATEWPWVSAHEYLEAHGREWLAQTWTAYPVMDYG